MEQQVVLLVQLLLPAQRLCLQLGQSLSALLQLHQQHALFVLHKQQQQHFSFTVHATQIIEQVGNSKGRRPAQGSKRADIVPKRRGIFVEKFPVT